MGGFQTHIVLRESWRHPAHHEWKDLTLNLCAVVVCPVHNHFSPPRFLHPDAWLCEPLQGIGDRSGRQSSDSRVHCDRSFFPAGRLLARGGSPGLALDAFECWRHPPRQGPDRFDLQDRTAGSGVFESETGAGAGRRRIFGIGPYAEVAGQGLQGAAPGFVRIRRLIHRGNQKSSGLRSAQRRCPGDPFRG